MRNPNRYLEMYFIISRVEIFPSTPAEIFQLQWNCFSLKVVSISRPSRCFPGLQDPRDLSLQTIKDAVRQWKY